MSLQNPLAVLADIHGNSFALEAVLLDMKRRGINRFVNLGDSFYGPLDPAGTWHILREQDVPTVLGNQDRILMEGGFDWEQVPAFQAAVSALGEDGMAWLRDLPATRVIEGDILLCHGTPKDDMTYLIEEIGSGAPATRECRDIKNDLFPSANGCTLVLAGHSHHPGVVDCAGTTIVNPGSVGLPSYEDDSPPHIMSSGTPYAKYGVVARSEAGWQVEFISVQYDWQAAADMARTNGRDDWAQWLLTGLA